MKKFIISVLLSIFSVSAFAVPATVGYVFDGDTFAAKVKLEDNIKISVRVRIIDIDVLRYLLMVFSNL